MEGLREQMIVKPLPKFSAGNTNSWDVQEIAWKLLRKSQPLSTHTFSYEAGYASNCHGY